MPPARRTETLAKIPLFRSLAAADVARLDTQCSWRHAPSGQWLLDHQDASSDVFFVVAGAVRGIIQSGGREVLLRQVQAGGVFGGLAPAHPPPRPAGSPAASPPTTPPPPPAG